MELSNPQIAGLLYRAIRELAYVQDVESCRSGLCATAEGKAVVERGMRALGVKDLSAESYTDPERGTLQDRLLAITEKPEWFDTPCARAIREALQNEKGAR